MEWVEIIELTEEFIRIRYYPEQRAATGDYGEVTYFRKTDDWQFDKLVPPYGTQYALHACIAAQRCHKNGIFPKNGGVIGWY